MAIVYSGVVNPSVEPLPSSLRGVIGDADSPKALVLSGRTKPPRIGTIFTSGPTPKLPFGLISKVTARSRQGNLLIVSLVPVPITDATPELSFTGSLPLVPMAGAAQQARRGTAARSPAAHASSDCKAPSLSIFKAELDSVELRRAFLGAWPPQLELTLAVRTTESLGVSAAAVGINCDWTIAELGPYQEAIPVGPIVVPVYAKIPVTVGLHVNGTLNVGTFNVASTTVASVAAGFDYNEASLSQQGSNVWLSGSPSISGSAKLSASIALQAGLGIAKGANAHVEAAFGPELDWATGQDCKLDLNMGSLSAGVSVFGHNLNTPSFTPWQISLWSGCKPSSSTPTPVSPPSTPTPTPTPSPTPTPPSTPSPGSPSSPSPEPTPTPPSSTEGFFIEDDIYGGTWARTDPNNGTWYPKSTRPPNGAYWYPNGLGVAVSCAESAAPYEVIVHGVHETWSWWAHVTDGKWVPTVVFSTVWTNGLPAGLSQC